MRNPDWYTQRGRTPWTQWTESGLDYKMRLAEDRENTLPAAKPRVHFRVIESTKDSPYVAYPDAPETQEARHRWVLLRQSIPKVPQPSRTPLLRKTMDAEERGRILSVYLRPWTLLRHQATVHVPFLSDLNVVITTALPYRRRVSSKATVAASPTARRSFAIAWEDYQKHHIVSKHALKLIRNFMLTQMPESIEADEENSDTEKN